MNKLRYEIVCPIGINNIVTLMPCLFDRNVKLACKIMFGIMNPENTISNNFTFPCLKNDQYFKIHVYFKH